MLSVADGEAVADGEGVAEAFGLVVGVAAGVLLVGLAVGVAGGEVLELVLELGEEAGAVPELLVPEGLVDGEELPEGLPEGLLEGLVEAEPEGEADGEVDGDAVVAWHSWPLAPLELRASVCALTVPENASGTPAWACSTTLTTLKLEADITRKPPAARVTAGRTCGMRMKGLPCCSLQLRKRVFGMWWR